MIGCNGIKTEDGTISFKDGKIEIENEEGTATLTEDGMTFNDEDGEGSVSFNESGMKLPKDYPEDIIPVIDDSMIIMSGKVDEDETIAYSLSLVIEKDAKEVYEYYMDIMSEGTIEYTGQSNQGGNIIGSKDGAEISITVLSDSKPNECNAAIVVSVPK